MAAEDIVIALKLKIEEFKKGIKGSKEVSKELTSELDKLKDNAAAAENKLASLPKGTAEYTKVAHSIEAINERVNNLIGISNKATGTLSKTAGGISNIANAASGAGGKTGELASGVASLASGFASAGVAGAALAAIPLIIKGISAAFDGNADAIERANQRAEEYKKIVEGVHSEIAKERANVFSLVSVLNNENESRERKMAAIKELQKINPTAFKDLDIEHGKVVGLTEAYANYITSLRNATIYKIKNKQYEKSLEKQLNLTNELEEANKKSAEEAKKNFGGVSSTMGLLGKMTTSFLSGGMASYAAGVKKLDAARKDLYETIIENAKLEQELAKLSENVDLKIADPEKTKDVKTFADVINSLQTSVKGYNAQLKQGLITTEQFHKSVVGALKGAVEELGKMGASDALITSVKTMFDYNILQNVINESLAAAEKELKKNKPKLEVPAKIKIKPLEDTDILGLQKKIDATNYLTGISDMLEQVVGGAAPIIDNFNKNYFNKFKEILDINALLESAEANPAAYLEKLKYVFDALKIGIEAQKNSFDEFIKNSFQQLGAGLVENIGTSLGDALSGGNFAQSLGKGFLNIISSFLQKVGAKLVELGMLSLMVQDAFKNPFAGASPATMIIAGIAMMALSQAFKGVQSQGFARGGYVSGSGTSTSDSIPANLSNGEYVMRAAAVKKLGVGYLNSLNNLSTPTATTAEVGGGVAVSVNVEGVVSGDNLRILLNRANKSYNRLT